jgi:hypothetical protein
MGGVGSGNFRPHMTTVEHCVCLDLAYLSKLKALQTGVRREGTLYWPAGETRESSAQIQ